MDTTERTLTKLDKSIIQLTREIERMNKGISLYQINERENTVATDENDLFKHLLNCTHYKNMSLTKTERSHITNYLEQIRQSRVGWTK